VPHAPHRARAGRPRPRRGRGLRPARPAEELTEARKPAKVTSPVHSALPTLPSLPRDIPTDAPPMLHADDPIIHIEEVRKTYQMGVEQVHALRGLSLDVFPNDYVANMGPSGSGKSTLMNIVGCLDIPTTGRYVLNGRDVSTLSDDALAAVRNREIGF